MRLPDLLGPEGPRPASRGDEAQAASVDYDEMAWT